MQNPASVLYLIHSLGHGGMERQVAALCLGMNPERYRPHVATVIEGFRSQELREAGIPVFRLPLNSFFDPGPLALTRTLRHYIRANRIQLLHLFDAGQSLVGAAAARLSGICLLSSQRFYMDLIPAKHRYLLLGAHWTSAGVVANSEAVRQHLHRDYRYPLDRIDLCHNGVDTAQFRPEPRVRLDALRDADLVIGTVSVLRPEKNLGQLIRAFANVHAQRPGARLLILGSGPEENALRQTADACGVSERCLWLPSTADVRSALRSMDIFVNCSFSEGLPNAVMEAMACGCCPVATRVGGTPELIEHGVHGLLAHPADQPDLEAQLRRACDRPDERARMSSAAAARMQQTFSLEASALKMQEIYDRRLQYYPGTVTQ